jgi:hypothetical protein
MSQRWGWPGGGSWEHDSKQANSLSTGKESEMKESEMNPSRTMFLLPYHVRDDSDARGYDEWLRSMDNPFFNGQREITHYTNWKVAEWLGQPYPFTHVDLMFVPDLETAPSIWVNEEIAAFARGWQDLWAPDSSADLSLCVSILLCTEIVSTQGSSGTRLLLTPDLEGELQARRNASRWRVVEPTLGFAPFSTFDILYLDGEPPVGTRGAVCKLIASPDA